MIEWYCTRRIGMKKTLKLLVLASLLLTLFGCSSPAPAKEVKEASVLYDNVQITYPEESDYTYENVSADWFSFFSKEKGTEININRALKDDGLNADDFMKSSFPEDKLIEEDGVVYAEYQDGLLRVLENTYYLYVIYRLPFKAETTDEAKTEIDQIFKKMSIDPDALVDKPQLPDDGFMYEKMVIHTPASMAFKESTGEYDYGLISLAQDMLIYINKTDKKDYSDRGYDEESLQNEIYKNYEQTEELTNGFRYVTYDSKSEAGNEYYNLYSLMYDDAFYYDVSILMRKNDQARLEETAVDILSKIMIIE